MNRVKLSMAVGIVPALLLALGAVSPAQTGAPFSNTGDAFVCDSTNDNIWRCQDLDLNGDYNGPNEVINFYDDVAGGFVLGNNVGIEVAPDGKVYVADSSSDIILGLWDLNGDGDALDGVNPPQLGGEQWVFFDGGSASPTFNASGVVMSSAGNFWIDQNFVFWVAAAATSSGVDSILRLQDLNGDNDANDAGEALVYAQFPSNYIPQDVMVGPQGYIYYLENGTSLTKGVYRLHDDDPMGTPGIIDFPSEVSPFWTPATAGFFWGFDRDNKTQGPNEVFNWYVADTTLEQMYWFSDMNGDLIITPNEESVIWTAGGSTNIWNVAVEDDGVSVLAAESQTPDRLLRFIDNNPQNGSFNDPGEVIEVYSDLVSASDIGNPRSICMARSPTVTAASNPSIFTPFNITLDAAVGATSFTLWVSDLLSPLPAPPFGLVEIGIVPPAFAAQLVGGSMPMTGRYTLPIPAVVNPALIGFTAHLQALAGPVARFELSNLQSVTFGP